MNFEDALCAKCKKLFRIEYIRYPSNVDDKRDTYISCPYCNAFYSSIHLRGNEDIKEVKINNHQSFVRMKE